MKENRENKTLRKMTVFSSQTAPYANEEKAPLSSTHKLMQRCIAWFQLSLFPMTRCPSARHSLIIPHLGFVKNACKRLKGSNGELEMNCQKKMSQMLLAAYRKSCFESKNFVGECGWGRMVGKIDFSKLAVSKHPNGTFYLLSCFI